MITHLGRHCNEYLHSNRVTFTLIPYRLGERDGYQGGVLYLRPWLRLPRHERKRRHLPSAELLPDVKPHSLDLGAQAAFLVRPASGGRALDDSLGASSDPAC